jgi:hypothetical protein
LWRGVCEGSFHSRIRLVEDNTEVRVFRAFLGSGKS